MNKLLHFFTPNAKIDQRAITMMLGVQITFIAALWLMTPFVFLPKPDELVTAFADLWGQGLANELIVSFTLNVEALAVSTALSLALGYMSTMAFFRPFINLIGKLRFLSLAGTVFFLTLMTSSGHELKLSILTLSVVVFMVTGLIDVIASVEREQYDLCRVLRMSPWRTMYEVVVLGQADKAFDVIRQNAAIGWMMLSFAEAMSRSEGGIGAMLATQNKYFHLPHVIVIQIIIFGLGLGQDYALGYLKHIFCPYSSLTSEKVHEPLHLFGGK